MEADYQTEGYRILVADDDPAILELVEIALADQGYQLTFAADGREALEAFKKGEPHLVILDLWMPKMGGLRVLQEVKRISPQTEAIIMTASADRDSAIEALHLGAFDYIPKPFRLEQLQTSVRKALERYQLLVTRERLLKELRQQMEVRTKELHALTVLAAVVNRFVDLDRILSDALDTVLEVLGVEGGIIRLLDEATGELYVVAHRGRSEAFLKERVRVKPEDTLLVLLQGKGEAVVITDLWERGEPFFHLAKVEGYRAYAGILLLARDRMVGILAVLSRTPGRFKLEDIRFLTAIGHHIGLGIENARLFKKEEQLLRSEKLAAVGQLAAGVAHELGNTLAIIGGSVQYLLKNGEGGHSYHEYLEVIHRNVAQADRIIRNLLSFARPRDPTLAPVDIAHVLEGTCLWLKGKLAEQHISVFHRFSPEVPLVMADQEQLQQVFLNLLLNAIQAMPEGGSITLTTAFDPEGNQVKIEVADTGKGIPHEHLSRIFDPFFTTKDRGTGLGLSISYRLIQAHKGSIQVESWEGKGTVFTLFLPAVPFEVRHAEGPSRR